MLLIHLYTLYTHFALVLELKYFTHYYDVILTRAVHFHCVTRFYSDTCDVHQLHALQLFYDFIEEEDTRKYNLTFELYTLELVRERTSYGRNS